MANINDVGVKVFVANALGNSEKMGYTAADLKGANDEIMKLASNPSPENRYEIGQIMAYTVQDIMAAKESNWLHTIAEVKDIPTGAKAEFRVDLDNIQAFVQAKGATTPRSKMFRRYQTVETVEVSARPYVNYMELATGKVNFSDLLMKAANQMEAQKIAYIDNVLRTAAATMPTDAYASGSGIVKPTFDNLLHRMSRLGQVTILGDIVPLSGLSALAGYKADSGMSDEMRNEINNVGHIGRYLGADVVKYTSPLKTGTLDPVIDYKWLWLLVAGQESPLKVVNEGTVTSLDQTNIDDNSYEVCLRQNFGAGFVLGNVPTIGAYQDTTV